MAVEQKQFENEIEASHVEAGIEIFNKYGDMNNLETLSLGDVTKWEGIKAIDRGTIYAKLMFNKDRHEFQRKLNEILKDEYKRQNR